MLEALYLQFLWVGFRYVLGVQVVGVCLVLVKGLRVCLKVRVQVSQKGCRDYAPDWVSHDLRILKH